MYIPFQAQVTNQSGTIVADGQYSVIFNLYDQAVGGQPIWSERHVKIGVTRGMINVFLGSIASLAAVDFSQAKYLGITVDSDNLATTADPEMVPRSVIIPAFHAKNAEKLAGHNWTSILEGGSNDPAAMRIAANRIQLNGITQDEIATGGVASQEIQDGSVARADLATDVLQAIVPAGSILPFGGSSVPAGWLACDGSAYRSVDHPSLYAAIGSSWGNGTEAATGAASPAVPGQTNFNVPDLRGYFLRGRDGAAGRDPDANQRNGTRLSGQNAGNNVGSLQSQEIQGHSHYTVAGAVGSGAVSGSSTRLAYKSPNTGTNYSYELTGTTAANPDGGRSSGQVEGTGSETRPINAYVNYIIKH